MVKGLMQSLMIVHDFAKENKEIVTSVTITTTGVILFTIVSPTIAAKAASLIGAGACLALGFHIGKKVTNKVDEYLFLLDKEEIERLKKEYAQILAH